MPGTKERTTKVRTTRRAFIAGAALVTVLPVAPARATPESMAAAIKEVVGDNAIHEGRVTLDLPPLIENGNAVPLTVSVESPMSESDHIKAIHVFNEKNPQPHVFHATFGPRNGKAVLATRIKLGDSQKIVAIAETSKGEFFSASADVIVTLAACLEDLT
jgi:sulfur-oxidizing protein SoxY